MATKAGAAELQSGEGGIGGWKNCATSTVLRTTGTAGFHGGEPPRGGGWCGSGSSNALAGR